MDTQRLPNAPPYPGSPHPKKHALFVANCAVAPQCVELPCTGACVFDLESRTARLIPRRGPEQVSPFTLPREEFWCKNSAKARDRAATAVVDKHEDANEHLSPFSFADAKNSVKAALRKAVEKRVLHQQKHRAVGLLFSGGLDSTVLAGMAAEVVQTDSGGDR